MTLYLQANLLLGVSYCLLKLARWLAHALFKNSGAFRPWVITAQLLVLASLAAPAVLSLFPTHSFPSIEFRVSDPLPETGSNLKKLLTKKAPVSFNSKLAHVTAPEKSSPLFKTENLIPALFAFLLLGTVFSLALLAARLRALLEIGRRGLTVRNVGRVSIVVSDSVSTPFSALLGRSAFVVIPPGVIENARDYRVSVLHELQHHRQGDTAWAVLAEVLSSLFFINPFIYLWKKEIVELQEFSCDESLLGQGRVSAKEYGSCLVRVAEATLRARDMLAGTACMASGARNPDYFKSFLRRRVEMFAIHPRSHGRKKLAAVLGTLTLIATLSVAYGSQRSFRHDEKNTINPGVPQFDPGIQAIAEEALKSAVHDLTAQAGFVIVADPNTGRILAVANVRKSSPTDSPAGPWALSYLIEPASAIKTIVAAAAVEKKATQFDELLDCANGSYSLGKHVYHDYTSFDHLTTADTIVKSSNICGIRIGEKLGPEGLFQALAGFGFGTRGVTSGFPSALAGEIPRPNQLPADEYIPLFSTGYSDVPGFYVNPLEMVQAYGAIANGGKLMKPIVATAPDSAVTQIRQVISAENSRQWRQVLARAASRDGTGTHAESAFYTTAGKTSTAYRPSQEGHVNMGGVKAVGGFVGFAPVEQPRVVIYAAIIDAFNRTEGNIVAAPLFREVAEKVLKSMKVAPDKGI